MGSTAPSVTGSRNLLECQLVASGPVSASPSPITQQTTRSGLSNAAPYARQGIPEFAAFMDRAGRLGCHMAGNPPWEGELPEQTAHAVGVAGDGRIDLTVGAFEVRVGDDTRPAVAGAHDVDRV